MKGEVERYKAEKSIAEVDKNLAVETSIDREGLCFWDAEQLWETTMDPEKRTLRQVTVQDALEVDRVVSELMGTDVECRRNFITKHARDIDERFLDI